MRCAPVVLVVLVSCATPRQVAELSQKDMQDGIVAHQQELGVCIDQEKRRAPGTHAKVLLRFAVLPGGELHDVEAASEVPPELFRCLAAVFTSSVRFPQHTVDPGLITYPLKY